MSYFCIDVSEWQGNIDWAKVKSAKVDAAIVRVGGRYGVSGAIYQDSKGLANLSGANKQNIHTGAYFFTQAVNEREAVEEAEYTIDKVKGFKIDMPLVIDTEFLGGGRHDNIGRQQRTAVCKAFCDRVKKSGFIPMIYGSTSWLNNQLDMSKLRDYQVWVAQYNSTCQYKGEYGIWQYSSTGRVSGVNGNCDVNYGYVEYWNGFTPTPKDKLDTDGLFGKLSVSALQEWLGMEYVDGVISGQLQALKDYFPNLISVAWEACGSLTIIALQNYLRRKGYAIKNDGYFGPDTILALQKFLVRESQMTEAQTKKDGRGYFKYETAKAFQKFLNGVFK